MTPVGRHRSVRMHPDDRTKRSSTADWCRECDTRWRPGKASAPSGLLAPPAMTSGGYGPAIDHFLERTPGGHSAMVGDLLTSRSREALVADADAIAHGLAAAEDQIQVRIGRIDDDRAGQLGRWGNRPSERRSCGGRSFLHGLELILRRKSRQQLARRWGRT
jgi:hypothetical protein